MISFHPCTIFHLPNGQRRAVIKEDDMITTIPPGVFCLEWLDDGVWEPVVPAEETIYNIHAGQSYKFFIFGMLSLWIVKNIPTQKSREYL